MAKEDTRNRAKAALSCVFVCRLNHTKTPRPNGSRWLASHGSSEAEEMRVAMSAAFIYRQKKRRIRLILEPLYDGEELYCVGSDLETIMSDHRVLLGHPEAILRMQNRGAEFTPPPRSRADCRRLLLETVAFVLAVFDAEPSDIRACHVTIDRKREAIAPDDESLAASYEKYRRTHFAGASTGKASLTLIT